MLSRALLFGDPMDCSPPGSSVHGTFQARTLEWGATSSSRDSSQPRDQPISLAFPALAGGLLTLVPPGKPLAINAGEGVEKREPSYTVGGNAN